MLSMKLTQTDDIFSRTILMLFLCRNKSVRIEHEFLENHFGIIKDLWNEDGPKGAHQAAT
jgi:hypothetical protein